MKLLLINYEYPPVGAGAATATQAIARALVGLGHVPHVLTTSFGSLRGTVLADGVHVHRIWSLRRRASSSSILEMGVFLASALLHVRNLVRRHQIDGVIAFFSFPCGPIARWAGRPYIVSLRGGDVPGAEPTLARVHALLAPIRRAVLLRAHAVVANSEGLRAMSAAADPIAVEVIPNGVDTEFFQPRASRPEGHEPFRWLFVGRFQAQKNLVWLLHRLAALRSEAGSDAFTIDLVGDGPQRAQLMALTDQLGLTTVVRWHDWQERSALRARYQQADALINVSLYEGMPNVVLEAMACGLPVLASRVAGNDAVVEDGVTGRLIDLGDADALIASLREWQRDPATARRMGAAARMRAVRRFSWTSTAQGYLQLFAAGIPGDSGQDPLTSLPTPAGTVRAHRPSSIDPHTPTKDRTEETDHRPRLS